MEQKNKQAERDRMIVRIVETYSDMLMRIALNRMPSIAAAEDAVQSTFERLVRKQPVFESREHEKAWLIRTVIRERAAQRGDRSGVLAGQLRTARNDPHAARKGSRRRVPLLLRGVQYARHRGDPRRARGHDAIAAFPRTAKTQNDYGRRNR